MAISATDSLIEVRLHGPLRAAYGDSFTLAIQSIGEAIRALSANLEGFPAVWRESSHYQLLVNGQAVPLEEIHLLRGPRTTIDIVPAVMGAKNAADQQLVFAAAWAVIAVVANFIPGVGQAISSFATKMALTHLFMAAAIALTKEDNAANDDESDPSRPGKNFNGAVNTTAQGRPVPLCYGRLGIGSHVVSAALVTEDTKA